MSLNLLDITYRGKAAQIKVCLNILDGCDSTPTLKRKLQIKKIYHKMLKKLHDKLSLFSCHSSKHNLLSLSNRLPLQKDKSMRGKNKQYLLTR